MELPPLPSPSKKFSNYITADHKQSVHVDILTDTINTNKPLYHYITDPIWQQLESYSLQSSTFPIEYLNSDLGAF